MGIKSYLTTFIDDFKAGRRGEVRVAPRGARGRVYAPKEGATPLGEPFRATATPEAVLSMTITRVDGTVERITVPAQVTRNG